MVDQRRRYAIVGHRVSGEDVRGGADRHPRRRRRAGGPLRPQPGRGWTTTGDELRPGRRADLRPRGPGPAVRRDPTGLPDRHLPRRHPRHLHLRRPRARARRRHREADDDRRRVGCAGSWTPCTDRAATSSVTFNYRYSPRNSVVRQLIADGVIGDGHLGPLRVAARHRARRRLLPPLAPREGQLRRSAGAQGARTTSTSSTGGSTTCRPGCTPRGGLKFYGAENAAERGLGARPELSRDTRPARTIRSGSTCATTTRC